MKITVEKKKIGSLESTLVQVEGEIDMHRSPELRKTLMGEFESKPKRLVVSFAKVAFMDSSGVATLVEALKFAKIAGSDFILCELSEKVKDVFELARLDKVFKIVSKIEEVRE